MRKFLTREDITLIGHNILRFDIPTLERLLDIKIKAVLVDTLALSWALFPDRQKHGLEVWGEEFGVPKPQIDDWENLPIEEYIRRCEEDTKINTHLWNKIWDKLVKLYDNNEPKIWEYIRYLSFKMYCAHLAEKNKWKLDVEFTRESLDKLESERKEKIRRLQEVMPKVPVTTVKRPPANPYKKDGTLSKTGQAWYDLLSEHNLPFDTEEVEVVTGHKEPNPASTTQIKDWLFSLGWQPRTFKHTKDKNGNPKQIPQINMEHGKGICPSIKELYETEPELELLDGLSVLNHRIPILQGFINSADENGYVQAKVQGLTNTLRFKHAHPCVNLPKAERPYGFEVRGSLKAPDGYELCGADMSSLEDRLKQHFIFPLDPDYVHSMNQEDFDPHITIAVMADMLTPEQGEAYKQGDKTHKPIRDQAKNGNYACQYGAFPPKLSITCGISLEKAQRLFDAYWELNWAVKEVAESQEIKTIDNEMWLRNPLNGFYYSLRFKKDSFSTLIQGTASYVFDLWVKFVLEKTDRLIGQFHDEIILCVKKGYREEIESFLIKTINRTNETLKLNRDLGIGIQFGDRYSEIH